MPYKFCCYKVQTAVWYGRQLRSKDPECSVASVAVHDELLQYSQDARRVQQNSPEQSRQNSALRRKRARSMHDLRNNILARVPKCDRGTGSELLARPATTETVLVAYELEIRQHGADAEDSQDTLENESRGIPATIGLYTIYRTLIKQFAIAN